ARTTTPTARTGRATCSASTTRGAATRLWTSGTKCASATAPGPMQRTVCAHERAGSPLHRGARGPARVAARVRREGDPAACAGVGGGRGVPAGAVQPDGRARLPGDLL